MSIIAKELTFIYNPNTPFAKKAVDNVSLTINDGEFVAIVGHTGSGKTTFLQHLNALIRVQSGALEINGLDVSAKKVDLKKLRGMVGMVFQYPEYQLFADTVELDVAFGPKNLGIEESEIAERVKNALQLVGMDYEACKSKSPFDLSGGEKRRVALAGVLAMHPQVLVLDEPTAGLDPEGKREILTLVKKLNKEHGITVLTITHYMEEAVRADRVVVLNEGKIALEGTPAQVFSNAKALRASGLELPQCAQLLEELTKAGVPINAYGITPEECARIILAAGGGNHVSKA